MDSPEQDTLVVASEASSPGRLLESGFLCVRQRRYAEGLTFFALARERLAPEQAHLAAVLDAFTQSHETYLRAQEELLRASKRFARADAEQQVQIAALESLLSILPVEMKKVSQNVDGLQHNGRSNRLLHILRSSSEDFNSNQLSTQSPQRATEDNRGDHSLPPSSHEDNTPLPALYINCFGRFEVKRDQQMLVLCQNRSGQSILRYLMAQPGYCATTDMLMAMLWPDDEQEVARRKLQVSASALRRSLNSSYTSDRGGGYILCKNQFYLVNPAVSLKTDVDEFLQFYESGRHAHKPGEMVAHYERACQLYSGPFLVEDTYADWACRRREQLGQIYLSMCNALSEHALAAGLYENAVHWARILLAENQCDEGAHRQLMLAYVGQGRRIDALQQFQRCERILHDELRVEPMPETVRIFQAIQTYSGRDESGHYAIKIERK